MQAERDRAKAEREIADKQNAVASNALSAAVAGLDDSSAGRKAKKQADEKLTESRKDLTDYLSDYEYEQRIDELDKLKEENDKYYNNQIDSIKSFLDDEVALYKTACDMIDMDSGELYANLLRYSQKYTTTTEAEFNHMWTSAQSAMQEYNSANLGTFELMNNLQGRIYEVDTAIDTVADGISAYESRIQGVQDKLTNLSNAAVTAMNDIAAAIQAEDKRKDVQVNKPKWYYDWQGVKYNSIEENRDDAIVDIIRQIESKYGGVFPASASTIYGTIKHYATGTRDAVGGVSVTQEDGLEAIFGKLQRGEYTMMPQGSQVFTKKQTDNLYDFSENPQKYISNIDFDPFDLVEAAKNFTYAPYLANTERLAKNIANIETPKREFNITVPITNNIQGNIDDATLQKLEKKEKQMYEKFKKQFMLEMLREKNNL